jgi:hypothetical protein
MTAKQKTFIVTEASQGIGVEGGAPKFLGRIGPELSVEDGRRATRLVFGMASLPVGVCVVLESIFEIGEAVRPLRKSSQESTAA